MLSMFLVKELALPDHPFKSSHDIIGIHFVEPIMIESELILKLQFNVIIDFLEIFLIKEWYFSKQNLINRPHLNDLTTINDPIEYSIQILQRLFKQLWG